MKKLIAQIAKFTMTSYIVLAMGFPVIIGIVFVTIWFLTINQIYNGNIPQSLSAIGLACFGFFTGCSGIVQIIRRESPGFTFTKPFRGIAPLISGILIVLIFWSLSLIGLYLGLFEH